MMHNVKILPYDKTIKVDESQPLRDHLIQNGFEIKSTCGGCASCGACVVIIKNGGENLTEVGFEEKQLLGNVYHITNERLSCQTKVLGDITVDISAHIKKNPTKVIRKDKAVLEQEKIDRENTPQEANVKEGGFRKPRAFNFDDEN